MLGSKETKEKTCREGDQSAAFIRSTEANVKRLTEGPPPATVQGHTLTSKDTMSTIVSCSLGITWCLYTHVNDVGEVVDVVFEDAAVGGLKSQQVLIPGLDGLQLVLCVLSLSLIRERERERERL